MPAISLKRTPSVLKSALRKGSGRIIKQLWGIIPRSLYLGKKPSQLMVALTRVCNINCVFCPYQFARKQDTIHMPDDIFRKVLHGIESLGITDVMLSPNIGEPLLAPRFLERVTSLRRSGVEFIEVTTNGTWLHRVGLEAMLREGPDQINLSFPGFDQAMYERVTRSQHYERTKASILELLRMNKAMRRPKIINLWLRGDLAVDRLMMLPEMGEVIGLVDDISVMTEVDDWLGLIRQEMLPPGYRLQTRQASLSRRPCELLFTLTAHPDGDIQLCSCRNIAGDPDLRIGNIREISLAQAHSSIPAVLRKWESGRYPDCCKTCSMYIDPAIGFIGRVRKMAASGAQQPFWQK